MLTKETTFDQDSHLYRIALIEKQTKLLITDWNRNLLHLLDLNGNLKIADFGLSKSLDENERAYSFCGSSE